MSQALKNAKLPFGATAAEPKQLEAFEFKKEAKDYGVYWDVRKGLIPIVGAARETGAFSLSKRPCTHIPTKTLTGRLMSQGRQLSCGRPCF